MPTCLSAPTTRAVVFCAAVLVVAAAGCSQNPFRRSTSQAAISLEPPPGVAAPAATLPQTSAATTPLPSYADLDGRQLQASLVRSREESQLLQDEIAVLREQLASTSGQLAQSRAQAVGRPMGPSELAASGAALPVPGGGSSLQAGLGQLSIPGAESRFDGSVVRIELSADRLFEGGNANIMPSGTALLTQSASEIERVFPRHFVGIEAHVDTAPLEQASWGSPHQLTAARAAAVFDFFTSRTSLRQGQLFIVAHGSNHPVVSNATAAGRTRNRRVELVIYPERIGSGDAAPAAPQ
jgi:flagellar motor protein MotB